MSYFEVDFLPDSRTKASPDNPISEPKTKVALNPERIVFISIPFCNGFF